MGQALYRKYRSKSLSEIVGQEHITDTLARAIKAGKISHAYLFTGPRGVGKTSVARILAHEVNNLPYTDESIHLDIIEIDAASNRRIDEIRDLRDKVHITPSSAKYKVYIIDEVHMLTKEAFNALLKTLEEPPAHVIFILATTEVHKLPETIISRTQRFTFKAIEDDKAISHLADIAKKEGISIDKEALALLAHHGGGSFRDAIGLLDQVGGDKGKVTKADVEQLLGVAPEAAVSSLLNAVIFGTPSDIVKSLDDFTARGIAAVQIAKQLSSQLRQKLLDGVNAHSLLVADLLKSLLEVASSPDPSSSLEVALFSANLSFAPSDAVPVANPKPPIVQEPAEAEIEAAKVPSEPKPKSFTETKVEAPTERISVDSEDISDWWPKFVNGIKKHNNTLYGVLRMAHPTLQGNNLSLGFAFGFHAKKITDPSTLSKIHESLKDLTGRDLVVKAVQDKTLKGIEPSFKPQEIVLPEPESEEPELQESDPNLSAITNIFGGGEVLEN